MLPDIDEWGGQAIIYSGGYPMYLAASLGLRRGRPATVTFTFTLTPAGRVWTKTVTKDAGISATAWYEGQLEISISELGDLSQYQMVSVTCDYPEAVTRTSMVNRY